MASNSSSEYKVIADKIVSPDEDIIVQVTGDIYKGSITSNNRLATIADVNNGGGGGSTVKTWTAANSSVYEIYQAHGGVEVEIEGATPFFSSNALAPQNYISTTYITLELDVQTMAALIQVYNGVYYNRGIYIIDANSNRHFVTSFSPIDQQIWGFNLRTPITLNSGDIYGIEFSYGGAPVAWWTADTLGLVPEGDEFKFRGAKIDYHAYSQDNGTIIGTIYLAHDNGDHNVTHLEVTSGANDNGTVILWKRNDNAYSDERNLFAYRADGESDTLKIHWTAQVYYSPEFYD